MKIALLTQASVARLMRRGIVNGQTCIDTCSVTKNQPEEIMSINNYTIQHSQQCLQEQYSKINTRKDRIAMLSTYLDVTVTNKSCECGHDKHQLGFSAWCPAFDRHSRGER